MAGLEACGEHEPIADRDDDEKGDDGGRDTAGEEVFDIEVALAGSLVFHHDGSCGMLEWVQEEYRWG